MSKPKDHVHIIRNIYKVSFNKFDIDVLNIAFSLKNI